MLQSDIANLLPSSSILQYFLEIPFNSDNQCSAGNNNTLSLLFPILEGRKDWRGGKGVGEIAFHLGLDRSPSGFRRGDIRDMVRKLFVENRIGKRVLSSVLFSTCIPRV